MSFDAGYRAGSRFADRYPNLTVGLVLGVPLLAAIGLGAVIRAIVNLF